MPVEDVITVSVPVTDQGRALAFYVGTLGLKLARVDETMLGIRHVQVSVDGPTRLSLVTWCVSMPAGSQLKVGAMLTNRLHDATGTTTFTPTVKIVEPGRELRWLGRVGPASSSTASTPLLSPDSGRTGCCSPSARTSPAWVSRSTKATCTPTPCPSSAP
jgi:hypothetical protein